MNYQSLESTARSLVPFGKGILAADESFPTIQKRFDQINILSTEETRRDYRHVLFTTADIEKYISGVILFDETLRQSTLDGKPLISILEAKGILPLLYWSSVEMILAEEVEILLAMRREVWDEEHKRTSFEKHLAEVDPFILYLSSLQTLEKKFSHFPSPIPGDLLGFIHFLQVEIKRLHNESLWPLYLPQIEEIL